MNKKVILSAMFLSLGTLLSGCGRQITTTKQTYHADGMVAVIKGNTNAKKQLTYQVDHQKAKQVTVNDGTFVIDVPVTNHSQQVKLIATSGQKQITHQVTVAAVKPLGNFAKIKQQYNQIVMMAALSKAQQQTLLKAQGAQQQLQQAKTGKITLQPQTIAQLTQTAQAAQTVIATAKQQSNALQLGNGQDGITNAIKQNAVTLRTNISNQQLINATLIVPTTSLKNKTAMKQFGTVFAALSQALGANSQQVMQSFQKQIKGQKNTQTAVKSIINHGIKYEVSFSKQALYIYISKQ